MESSFQLEGILGNLVSNPELLSSVLSMAGKLAEGFSSASKSESAEGFSSAPKSEGAAGDEVKALLPAPASATPHSKKGDMHKHKKLVEALMLYVREEKRPKLEMVLKILEIVELAEELRG